MRTAESNFVMKIAITGASSFIGRELSSLLAAEGVELLLVGEEPEHMSALFPRHANCSYEDLPERAIGFDLLVNLLVEETRSSSGFAFDVRAMSLVRDGVANAKMANVPRIVNIRSLGSLDLHHVNTAAREAIDQSSDPSDTVTTVILPFVYGDRWNSRLAFLNYLPRSIGLAIFGVLSAVRPTVHISRLAAFLIHDAITATDRQIILSDGQIANHFYHFFTRTIDITFAFCVTFFLWWALALIAFLIRMQSTGPAIFRQERVGRNRNPFICYKFRTMKLGTKQAATNEISADMVTAVGRFLRRTKLDELPQIWNILRNEISLVGPRPCLPIQNELVDARNRRDVLTLTPGISGLAQINDVDMSNPTRLALWDARYLALQSLELDFRIIIATATGRGRGDRVATRTIGERAG